MAELFLELVASEMRFSDLVESILSVMVEATGAEAGSILEFDHEKNEFFFRASRGGGDPEKLKAFRVPASKGIVGHVAETREALFLRDLETDQRQLLAISMSTGLDTKSCLAAAIEIGGQLYGVIELFNKKPDAFFHDEDFETLKRGVKMAAKVLEVRFLLAELARKAA
jgi:GAF domain-containing protein